MKRWLCLTLVVALCMVSVACGKEPVNTAAPTSGPKQTHPSSTVGNGLKLKECIDDVTWYQVFIDENGVSYGNRAIQTLSDGTYLVDGVKTGDWQMSYNTVQFDFENSQIYVLYEAHGVYYLAGNDVLWTSDNTHTIGTKTITIDMDNWQEYFRTDWVPKIDRWFYEENKYHDSISWILTFKLAEKYGGVFKESSVALHYIYKGIEGTLERTPIAYTPIGGMYYYDSVHILLKHEPEMIYGIQLLGPYQDNTDDFQMIGIEGAITLVDLPLTVVEYPA